MLYSTIARKLWIFGPGYRLVAQSPFTICFGRYKSRDKLVVKLRSDGINRNGQSLVALTEIHVFILVKWSTIAASVLTFVSPQSLFDVEPKWSVVSSFLKNPWTLIVTNVITSKNWALWSDFYQFQRDLINFNFLFCWRVISCPGPFWQLRGTCKNSFPSAKLTCNFVHFNFFSKRLF